MNTFETLYDKFYERQSQALPWLKQNTIFLTVHGSHAYGTNIEGSDVDFKGIAIPPKEYFLTAKRFEQATSPEGTEPDMVVYEIRKFFDLAANCNPNIIEVLFTDPEHYQIKSQAAQNLLDNKKLFLSKKARFTFSGYGVAQLKRIELHRKYLLSPLTKAPERVDFGLPEKQQIKKEDLALIQASVEKQLDRWHENLPNSLEEADKIAIRESIALYLQELKVAESTKVTAACRELGLGDNLIEIFQKERQYVNAVKQWEQYLSWKKNRNEGRAKLEEKFGYDTKHAMHLCRLLIMAEEILRDGKVIVNRPDKAFFLSIRNGGWTYEQVIEFAEKQQAIVEELYKTSDALPKVPPMNKINELCQKMVEDYLFCC